MHFPTIIDLGTEEDAGHWLREFPFLRFPISEYPAPVQTLARDSRKGAVSSSVCTLPATCDLNTHANPTSREASDNHAA